MTYLWKIVRTLMVVVGICLILGAVGTSDYYLLELGQKEPSSVWTTIVIGFVLIAPAFVHGCYQTMKGGCHD